MRRPIGGLVADLLAPIVVALALLGVGLPLFSWALAHPVDALAEGLRAAPLVVRQLTNGLAVGALALILVFSVAIPAGYALARRSFLGRRLALGISALALAMPPSLVLSGWSAAAAFSGLRGTLTLHALSTAALLLPAAIWLVMLAFLQVPTEIEDAARLEGLSQRAVLVRVALPLATGSLAAIAAVLWSVALGDQLSSAVVATPPELRTLAGALAAPGLTGGASPGPALLAIPAALLGALGLPRVASLVAGSLVRH